MALRGEIWLRKVAQTMLTCPRDRRVSKGSSKWSFDTQNPEQLIREKQMLLNQICWFNRHGTKTENLPTVVLIVYWCPTSVTNVCARFPSESHWSAAAEGLNWMDTVNESSKHRNSSVAQILHWLFLTPSFALFKSQYLDLIIFASRGVFSVWVVYWSKK